MLCNKALQEIVHAAHHLRVTVDFVRAKLFNGANADFFHVPRDNPGECATQVCSQHFNRLVWIQFQIRHVFVGRFERHLQI